MRETAPAAGGRSFSSLVSQSDRPGLIALVTENLRRFTERDVLQAIRHPHCGRDVLEQVLLSRTFMSLRAVRKAAATHPACPRAEGLQCLEDLPWRDLLDVGREVRAPMPVRHSANLRILEKLHRLSLGEKIALSRLADRQLLPALLKEEEPRIFSAVLRNPRLMTDDLVTFVSVGRPTVQQLEQLAADERWCRMPPLRQALLANRGTPRPTALTLLREGTRPEWRRVLDDPSADPLLKACAERLYRERTDRIDRRAERL